MPKGGSLNSWSLKAISLFSSVSLFFISKFFKITIKTETVMTGKQFTTGLTLPSFFLPLKEFFHSIFLDENQVLYHTHSVAIPVSLINDY